MHNYWVVLFMEYLYFIDILSDVHGTRKSTEEPRAGVEWRWPWDSYFSEVGLPLKLNTSESPNFCCIRNELNCRQPTHWRFKGRDPFLWAVSFRACLERHGFGSGGKAHLVVSVAQCAHRDVYCCVIIFLALTVNQRVIRFLFAF